MLLVVGAAVSAHAQVIDTYPFWDGSITAGWTAIGQSFDAPGSTLTDYQFAIEGNANGGTLNVSVFNWIAGTGPTGASLYSTSVAWPTSTGDVVLSGLNIPMTVGGHYGVVVDLSGSTSQSVHYMGNTTGNPSGNGYWSGDDGATWNDFPGLSTEFKATFSSVPEPASMAVLGVGALALLRRRRQTN
ncbi:MAG: PEP-CTERM sorting domain-containing protein [Armatimonadetes bacterium]|nr:PEP-CTERM sorting domain-containing protein [Armatimonadota bacterium]MBS1728878.1 PEP-CTERM sorting domain-containing protein [Armatimonadota bacterium]